MLALSVKDQGCSTNAIHNSLFPLGLSMILCQNEECLQARRQKFSPNRMMIHRRMAIRAPVLRPTGRKMASALQVSREPSDSQPHTRMVRVPVLLLGG